MANLDITNDLGVVDTRVGRGFTASPISTANYDDIGSLRTRLNAISSTLYPAARLEHMTKNDMVYAVRLNDDAAGM